MNNLFYLIILIILSIPLLTLLSVHSRKTLYEFFSNISSRLYEKNINIKWYQFYLKLFNISHPQLRESAYQHMLNNDKYDLPKISPQEMSKIIKLFESIGIRIQYNTFTKYSDFDSLINDKENKTKQK